MIVAATNKFDLRTGTKLFSPKTSTMPAKTLQQPLPHPATKKAQQPAKFDQSKKMSSNPVSSKFRQ